MIPERPDVTPIPPAEPVSPPPGTWVLIRQPNGGPDRWMAIADPKKADPNNRWPQPNVAPAVGWLFLFGFVVDGDGECDQFPRHVYAHPAGADWEMVPYVEIDPPGPELAAKNDRLLRQRLGQRE